MIEIDGEPWWVLSDVCRAREIANSRQAAGRRSPVAGRLEYYQKGVTTTDTLGGSQVLTIVNQAGLNSLIFASRKPVARAFEKWVTT